MTIHQRESLMIQFGKICGASLALVAMLVGAGAQAQTAGQGTSGIVDDLWGPLQGSIGWSKNAGSTYNLDQLTGSYYDNKVTTSETNVFGTVRTYQQYVKGVSTSSFTFDASGKLGSGTLVNELTWTGVANDNVNMRGGSFTLSNLHWKLLADGSAEVLATASGTGISSTDLLVFTTPATAVVTANWSGFALTKLTMSDATFSLWVQALGADDPNGLAYASLKSVVGNIGTLRIGAVPESATWLQMGLGLVGLGAAVLRRRSQR